MAQALLAIDFAALIEPVALRLLGEPNAKLSKPKELRFGNHGSLSVNLEAGTWFDHETKIGGGTLALIEHKTGRSGTHRLAWLHLEGLLHSRHIQPKSSDRSSAAAPRGAPNDQRDRDSVKRTEAALRMWGAAVPADGTLAEIYLVSRGLHLRPPPTLRFHAAIKHPSGQRWPAMVALVTRGHDDTPLGIHRTFLARDGAGKAPVEPQRMMLGPCCGGAVRLAPIGDVLMVGEGIENCLAAMQATGKPAWAALSTSGLRALELPIEAREVVVLADGDDPGEAAARDVALRWNREGRRVRIARPPRGADFNDLLLGRARQTEGSAA